MLSAPVEAAPPAPGHTSAVTWAAKDICVSAQLIPGGLSEHKP